MKSPREIILSRHRAAEPGLDAIRRQVLARELGPPAGAAEDRTPGLAALLWEQLVLPCRRAWLGLGTAWALALILNLTAGNGRTPEDAQPAHAVAGSAPELRQQRALRAELLDGAQSAAAYSGGGPGPSSQAPADANTAWRQPQPGRA